KAPINWMIYDRQRKGPARVGKRLACSPRAVGGGESWISSIAPRSTIDIPVALKDALYVRSHYDVMTLMLRIRAAERNRDHCSLATRGGQIIGSAA
ncbi:MAG: amino acid synthesis family protein, partial [Bradyrhizobium sp.]|nr:amino acid synthesis family protein [Bradyrhizobium sp.]